MSTTLDLDIIEIDDEQARSAKLLAGSLSEAQIRKRGMIDMLGISCAINYLHSRKFKIDTKRSVYKIPLLFEEFKITDIYWGNYRIDVITLYKEKTIKIPKVHVDMDILPHYYFIVQIGSKIKEAKIIGFIDAKNIPGCSFDSKFYYPSLDLVFNLDKFTRLTKRSVPTKTLLGKHIDCLGLFLKFMDNDLSSVYKRQLIQHLMNCDSCRMRFIDAVEFEKLANNIRHYPDLMKKSEFKTKTLNYSSEIEKKNKTMGFEESLDNIIAKEEDSKPALKKPNEKTEQSLLSKTAQFLETVDKTDKKLLSKKVIDTIFDEIPKIELPALKTVVKTKRKHLIMIIVALIFVLTSFTLISIKGSSDVYSNELQEQNFEDDSFGNYDDDYMINSSSQANIPPQQRGIEDYIIANPIPQAPSYSPTISKVSWEAPESLIKKENYTKFLQLTGKNVKLNLQNDLLLVNDIPTNKIAKVDVRIASNGDVISVKVSSTSGSDLIDDSIKKVIKETLTYMKPPSHGIISRPVDITLTLEFY